MPNPSSHQYDIKRTRLRDEYDERVAPDQGADRAANEELQRGDPPRPVELRSMAFTDHTLIPDRYSYDGGNTSPPLEWLGIPDGSQELVLMCEDPDAPVGTFVHWIVCGIAPDSTGVDEGTVPQGCVEGRNGFGELGWGGPRPPVGDEPHRYFFRLHAVDRKLGLRQGVAADEVRAALKGHVLERGTLVGLFGR